MQASLRRKILGVIASLSRWPCNFEIRSLVSCLLCLRWLLVVSEKSTGVCCSMTKCYFCSRVILVSILLLERQEQRSPVCYTADCEYTNWFCQLLIGRASISQVHLALTGDPTEMRVSWRTEGDG